MSEDKSGPSGVLPSILPLFRHFQKSQDEGDWAGSGGRTVAVGLLSQLSSGSPVLSRTEPVDNLHWSVHLMFFFCFRVVCALTIELLHPTCPQSSLPGILGGPDLPSTDILNSSILYGETEDPPGGLYPIEREGGEIQMAGPGEPSAGWWVSTDGIWGFPVRSLWVVAAELEVEVAASMMLPHHFANDTPPPPNHTPFSKSSSRNDILNVIGVLDGEES
ncbi:hypothetical protein BDK51DRAFT_49030 [Blyttiomyces helicus]|uniref:Uncharacterized protein n=1 Tax=Blyttiomyces helicus TaxID=388810 RepID=A0A4P9W194_9FUNG|nr:hypothetical protein BDK51DRAFT_49030 [Blyttiomyces helicus]|eukprot:RKO84478.1 hypothetical protein BDK51DRAFT_49030 [Blyttiomyces helicus]